VGFTGTPIPLAHSFPVVATPRDRVAWILEVARKQLWTHLPLMLYNGRCTAKQSTPPPTATSISSSLISADGYIERLRHIPYTSLIYLRCSNTARAWVRALTEEKNHPADAAQRVMG
jgi:hypothetical protein